MRDNLAAREFHHARDAMRECRKILNVQSAWINCIAGKQDACLAVVISQAELVMAGDREYIDRAPAQIHLAHAVRPAVDAENLLCSLDSKWDDCGVRPLAELAVASHVVAVRV